MIQSTAQQTHKSTRMKVNPSFSVGQRQRQPPIYEVGWNGDTGRTRRSSAAPIMMTITSDPNKMSPLCRILTQNTSNDNSVLPLATVITRKAGPPSGLISSSSSLINLRSSLQEMDIVQPPVKKVIMGWAPELQPSKPAPGNVAVVGVVKPELQALVTSGDRRGGILESKRRFSTALVPASKGGAGWTKPPPVITGRNKIAKIAANNEQLANQHMNLSNYLWINWTIEKIIFGALISYLVHHIRELKTAPVADEPWFKWVMQRVFDKLSAKELFVFGIFFILARIGIRTMDMIVRKIEIRDIIRQAEQQSEHHLQLKEIKHRTKREIWKTVTDGFTKIINTVVRAVVPTAIAEEVVSTVLDLMKEKAKEKAAEKERERERDKMTQVPAADKNKDKEFCDEVEDIIDKPPTPILRQEQDKELDTPFNNSDHIREGIESAISGRSSTTTYAHDHTRSFNNNGLFGVCHPRTNLGLGVTPPPSLTGGRVARRVAFKANKNKDQF